jgi:hypothetical protein
MGGEKNEMQFTIELGYILMSSEGHPLPSTTSRSKFVIEEPTHPLRRPKDNPIINLHSNLEFQKHLSLIIILFCQHFIVVTYVLIRLIHYIHI